MYALIFIVISGKPVNYPGGKSGYCMRSPCPLRQLVERHQRFDQGGEFLQGDHVGAIRGSAIGVFVGFKKHRSDADRPARTRVGFGAGY